MKNNLPISQGMFKTLNRPFLFIFRKNEIKNPNATFMKKDGFNIDAPFFKKDSINLNIEDENLDNNAFGQMNGEENKELDDLSLSEVPKSQQSFFSIEEGEFVINGNNQKEEEKPSTKKVIP